jgi:hypothetical protein
MVSIVDPSGKELNPSDSTLDDALRAFNALAMAAAEGGSPAELRLVRDSVYAAMGFFVGTDVQAFLPLLQQVLTTIVGGAGNVTSVAALQTGVECGNKHMDTYFCAILKELNANVDFGVTSDDSEEGPTNGDSPG